MSKLVLNRFSFLKFNFFNQILLNIVDILNIFYYNILIYLYNLTQG